MLTKYLILVALVTTIGVLQSGCATEEIVAYPADWPERVNVSKCTEVSGHYINEAIATTLWRSPTNAETARSFLARLLVAGENGEFDQEQRLISSIELNVNTKLIIMHRTDGKLATYPLSPSWSCASSGELSSLFEYKVDSEGAIANRAKIHVILSKAADGSLVTHSIVEFHALFPPGGRRESWARFQSLRDRHR